ncbi:hypothetical protein [Paenibacillus antibioticophila]|uniref:hypothetical protein n=1 Tax=Paenibacillus antibioticophila TaxID=1274374 RepID=UPI0005C9B461|nr:hypothetical protein [Paenibacillus antibioticophila]
MEQGMIVKMYEKSADGSLNEIDERLWSPAMISALEHVNYIVIQDREYEAVEGRLNIDAQILELLLVPIRNQ